jgi:hypothetical protein
LTAAGRSHSRDLAYLLGLAGGWYVCVSLAGCFVDSAACFVFVYLCYMAQSMLLQVSQENIEVFFLALEKNGKRKLQENCSAFSFSALQSISDFSYQDISKDVLVSLEGKFCAEVSTSLLLILINTRAVISIQLPTKNLG